MPSLGKGSTGNPGTGKPATNKPRSRAGGSASHSRQPERQAVPKKVRFEVMQRDGFSCRLCGRGQVEGVKLQLDHRIPISRGGTNDLSNLQTLCEDCNQGKSNRLL